MTTINEETLPRCEGCDTTELDPNNHCEFCYIVWCNTCKPEDISFHKCDTCNIKWCYYDGRYADYRCILV